MKNDKRCLLIVDDEIKILRALKDFFTMKQFEVLEAKDGIEALEIFYNHSTEIDMILLDVMMPKLNGYEVLKDIRNSSVVPIILLTAKGEEYDQIKGFEMGADDYVVKPFSPSLLLARMEAVLKRMGKDETGNVVAGAITINNVKRTAFVNDVQIELTRREFDLLNYLVLNEGISLTREQILNGSWGYEFEGDLRTVDTHIKQLRIKLKEYSGYIQTIHRVGYRFEVV